MLDDTRLERSGSAESAEPAAIEVDAAWHVMRALTLYEAENAQVRDNPRWTEKLAEARAGYIAIYVMALPKTETSP